MAEQKLYFEDVSEGDEAAAVSPRLPFRRVAIPGAAFIASIAYLIQKLAIHAVGQFCTTHNIDLTSAPSGIDFRGARACNAI